MPSRQQRLLCHYRYDPLDRLIDQTRADTPARQRFYCKSRLATEIQGALCYSIVQQGDQLLGQQQRQGDMLDTTLLATDQQRSVLHTQKADKLVPVTYSPYGHRPAASGLLGLLGFNGERPDPVTGHYLLGNGYRAFNPVLMRFNSSDSLSPFGKGGLNSYAYCLGDPINRSDPNGHSSGFIALAAKLIIKGRRAAARVVVKKGRTMAFKGEVLSLKPGVTPLAAVNHRAKLYKLDKLSTRSHLESEKFTFDLNSARKDKVIFENLIGSTPPHVDERLKLLEYLKLDGDGVPQLSEKRLREALSGKYSPRVPAEQWPAPMKVLNYVHERPSSTLHNNEFHEEYLKIRNANFT